MCLCTLSTLVLGSKILVLVPANGKSHAMYLKVFVEELIGRGHEVTCVTSYSMGQTHDNYTEILIDPPFNMQKLGKYKSKVCKYRRFAAEANEADTLRPL